MKATEARKHLFQILDSAIHGQAVEIVYKGTVITLTAQSGGSKLANVTRRNALLVDPQAIVESDSGLMNEWETGWRKDDQAL